ATRCRERAPRHSVEPRNVRAHPGSLSKPMGIDEPRLGHSGASRHSGHALPDWLRAIEAARRASEQRLRRPSTSGLRTAVAWRAIWRHAQPAKVGRGLRASKEIGMKSNPRLIGAVKRVLTLAIVLLATAVCGKADVLKLWQGTYTTSTTSG